MIDRLVQIFTHGQLRRALPARVLHKLASFTNMGQNFLANTELTSAEFRCLEQVLEEGKVLEVIDLWIVANAVGG